MFTGIIEEIGYVKSIERKSNTLALSIMSNKIITDINNGDSIAINGVCLTVTKFQKNLFTVDVMPETFNNTALKFLTSNAPVNLERAIAMGGRFGGHIVSGHVDTTGIISHITHDENTITYTIKPYIFHPEYCTKLGSIAIDGTSLTIFNVSSEIVQISLIPHTIKHSILGNKKIHELVNIEYDLFAKYIKTILTTLPKEPKISTNITDTFLINHGFAF